MSDFQRVKDKATGHEYSVRHVTDNHEVLKKAAVDVNGRPLPATPKTSVDAKSTESKKKSPTNGAESANTPEEG